MTTKLADSTQKHSVGINRGGGYWCAADGDLTGPCEHFPAELRAAPAMLEALIELNTELNLDALANHFPVAEAVVGKIKAAIRAGVGAQEENTQ